MKNYYAENLNATKLYDVYQTDIPRVKQYLDKEIAFVQNRLSPDSVVFEMGAGYGRIMKRLAPYASSVYGIDISQSSVSFGQQYLKACPNCTLSVADVYTYDDNTAYNAVLCLQNGLSAFKGNTEELCPLR